MCNSTSILNIIIIIIIIILHFSDFSSVFDFVKDQVGSKSFKQNPGHRLIFWLFIEKLVHCLNPVEVKQLYICDFTRPSRLYKT